MKCIVYPISATEYPVCFPGPGSSVTRGEGDTRMKLFFEWLN